ncbi:MAG TPA: tetratricopeptide repeat protein, partial [Gemmataceae bacterium]|nr:tetratricopeptide repeat protein [Gemmataceae bacterium]
DRQASGPEQKDQVLSLYEQALAREPKRNGLRRAAIDLAMSRGDFGRASDHLTLLAHYQPDDADVQDLLGQCEEALSDWDKAEAAYRKAVGLAPHRIGAYARLARLLRGPLARESDADQMMDDLIAANDRAADAYLERAVYRMAGDALDGAERDAAQARELAPEDARVRLTTADLAARRGRMDDARAALKQGLKHHPADMDLRLALAELLLQADRPMEAAECLEEEREALKDKKPAPDQSELIDYLAEARLKLGDTAAVEALAAEERRDGSIGAADYLVARLRMHNGQWSEAEHALQDSIHTSVMTVNQAVRTLLCLGKCCERLGDGDRRLAVLRQAADLAPWSAPAGAALGAALLDAGRTDEALDSLRRTALLPHASDEALPLLARALLLHNQALPRSRQEWAEVDRAIDRCGATAEAARLRAVVLQTRGDDEQAAVLLEQARLAHPDDADAWTASARDAARRGDGARALSLLDDARRRLGDHVEFRLTVLQIVEAAGDAISIQRLSDLEEGLDGWPAADRTLLLCRLATAYYRLGKMADGDRLCRRLAAEPASDLSARVLLLEALLPSEDDGLVNGVLADVARLEGDDGAWAQYGRAVRLAARAYRGDRSDLTYAKELLNKLTRQRPEWSRAALLQARLAELDGDSAAALDAFQRAFDLGERRPDVAQSLVHLLVECGRWDAADQVLRELQERMVFSGAVARQAAEIALQAHNGERAVELARQAAPAVDGYAYHVWLGRILADAARPDEAEIELRRAVHFPDAGWDATAALAEHLVQRRRTQEAESAVEDLRTSLPPRYAALPLAVCYEAAGRLDRAAQFYEDALAQRPNDGPTLVRVAAFHLRLNRPAQAEAVLRRLLNSGKDLSASDLAWARRELAMVLASTGYDGKYAEAMALLAAGPGPSDDPATRRARWFVIGSRPAGRAEALRGLDDESKAAPLPPDEEFRLAQLYEADARWPEARELLGHLMTVDKQNPEYLGYLIDGLLRHDQAEEAGPWTARLAELEPSSERVKAFQVRIAAAAH